MAFIFFDGFESGDTSAWDSTSGSPTASLASAMVGTYGVEINAASEYVEDSFTSTSRLRCRFWFDPNSYSMSSGDRVRILMMQDGGSDIGQVRLYYNGSNYQLDFQQKEDAGTWATSSAYTITDGPHCVEVDYLWQNTTGTSTMWIDGVLKETLSNVDSGTYQADSVEMGCRFSVGSPTGTLYFDHFQSNNDGGEIGCASTTTTSTTTLSTTSTTTLSTTTLSTTTVTTTSSTTSSTTTTTLACDFADSFESGDTSAWDGTNGTPVVSTDAALVGVYGLEVNASGDYVIHTFDSSTRFRVRFWIDPNSLTMANGDRIRVLTLLDGGTQIGHVRLYYTGGNYTIETRILDDASSWHQSSAHIITDASHCVETDWLFQNATGYVSLWIDDVFQETLANVDSGTREVDTTHLGWRVTAGTPSGTLYLDHYQSNCDGTTIGCATTTTTTLSTTSTTTVSTTTVSTTTVSTTTLSTSTTTYTTTTVTTTTVTTTTVTTTTTLYVPPAVVPPEPRLPTFAQSRTLPLLVYDPLWKSNIITDEMGVQADALQVQWTAWGGFWTLRFNLTAQQTEVEDWLENGLGRHVELYNPALVKIWEGFVNTVNVNIGSLTIQRGGMIDTVVNRCRVVYSTVDTSTEPPTFGIRAETDWGENTASQSKYGQIWRVVSVGGASEENAEQIRDTVLEEYAEPTTEERDNLGSSAAPSVTVEAIGYVHFLKAYTIDIRGTGLQDANEKLETVLGADPNGLISVDYSYIDTNDTQVAVYDRDDRTAWQIAKSLTALGDDGYNRWMFGLYKDRVARYEALPTDTRYQRSLRDPAQSLERYGTGLTVDPWDAEPGEWVFYTDLLIGKGPVTDKRTDPRYMLVEQNTFTAPWGLTIDGAKVGRIDQLLAQLGLGGQAG